MARKYGAKKVVADGLNNYRIGLLGESGIGKSTLIKNVCEEEFGDDGYIFINCGQESNIIDGIVEADAKDFKTVVDIVSDIAANKDTEYKDLKVIVFDTLDQLFSIAEQYVVAKWNRDNANDPKIRKAKSIRMCHGGFGGGEDETIKTVLSVFDKLKSVGVAPWYIGHVKTKELTDPITGGTYSKLTTNMTNRYFEAIKEKTNLIGIAAIDRTIEVQSTGKRNVVTNKDITINRVINERRKVSFRDSNFIIDAKSQFPHIVNEIPLDADEFIKAIKDAIQAAKSENSGVAKKINDFNDAVLEAKEELKRSAQEEDEQDVEIDAAEDETPVDDSDELFDETPTDPSQYPENLREVVKEFMLHCDKEKKVGAKEIMTKHSAKFAELNDDGLQELYDFFQK